MPWTRLDDGFHRNPKVMELTHRAGWLYVLTLNWSVANLTAGKVTAAAVDAFLPRETRRGRASAAEELVEVGLWERNGSGWLIHDFADYQEDPAEVAARRERWASNKRTQRMSTRTDGGPGGGPGGDNGEDSAGNPSRARPGVPSPSPLPIPIPEEPDTSLRSVSEPAAANKPRDLIFEEVFHVCHPDTAHWDDLTLSGRGVLNRAVAELKQVHASPQEIRRRAINYVIRFESLPTPKSLSMHWASLKEAYTRNQIRAKLRDLDQLDYLSALEQWAASAT